MISKILLHKIATYIEPVEISPSEINYMYGSNGTGKTTLSKVIANSNYSEDCLVHWKNVQMDTLVYNKQFVETNFGQSKDIKGIFTLGKNSINAHEAIENLNERIVYLKSELSSLDRRLSTINNSIIEHEDIVLEKCWTLKLRYDNNFRPAYSGFVGSKKNFLDKCISERSKDLSNSSSIDEILSKCKIVFSQILKIEENIREFHFEELISYESNDILTTEVIGKENSQVGLLIQKLQNSDWVKQGVNYLESSENHCPFCQEKLRTDFARKIEDFFDETYLQKCKQIEVFKEDYVRFVEAKIEDLRNIVRKEISIIDVNLLTVQVHLVKEILKNNVNAIDSKMKSPSISVRLESLSPVFEDIKVIVSSYKKIVEENNRTVGNLKEEQQNLKSEIWCFSINNIKNDLDIYLNSTDGLIRGRENITTKQSQIAAEVQSLRAQIRGWESQVTNITHTINEINNILRLFSFTNFSLAEASKKGYYKIVREDGTEGHETLSEGEYRFITFLYFYQLLKGSVSDTGITTDKVVVFDDPISSLDSSVLFVVSNLVKEVIKCCKNNSDGIKQVFILTHNIYFFKEVTFRGAKHKSKWIEESFWMFKRFDGKTKIITHADNPIKTSYELLWRELADAENINKATIFNSLRRILEYYFNIIGGLDYESCISSFDGEEKLICKSLVSWMNDGSHFINDDLVMHTDDEEVQKYLKVFKSIFEKMDHKSHYDMMMKAYNN